MANDALEALLDAKKQVARRGRAGADLKPTTTRTLNPLPFQDLEPHRFEDLVRQLAYDLRRWKSLEATGRGGSDSCG